MKNLLINGYFLIRNRFVLFTIFCILFVIVQYWNYRTFLPTPDTKDIWFYSGIFMVLFSMLFIEPYYSSPKNVVTNVIPLLLVFLSIKEFFDNSLIWWCSIIILLILLVISVFAITLEDKNYSPDYWKNIASNVIKNIVVVVGQGKILYSAMFMYFLLAYYTIQSFYTLNLLILWSVIVCINPKSLHNSFSVGKKYNDQSQIGDIFSVQSQKIFLIKLFSDRKNVKKFDIVKFKYSMQEVEDNVKTGVVFDTYLLDQEKWAKILQLKEQRSVDKLKNNVVYKIFDANEIKEITSDLKLNRFIGVVADGSLIGKIKFEYSKKDDDLQEGDLLELNIGSKRLFYQVIAGRTESEKLEDRNEISIIEGEAIQLGEWHDDMLSFQKFGWVPSINTPIFKTNTSDITIDNICYPNYQLGLIPGTSLPSVINLSEAISHHTALLGITGSGKSFLAKEIIREIQQDTKIICIDFNKEFVTTLNPMPLNIIENSKAEVIAEKIDWINNELEKFGNQQEKKKIETEQSEVGKIIKEEINKFLDDTDCDVKIFEIADFSNTTGILDYTKRFFRALFEISKERKLKNSPIKLCVVLEEAHTIIPEWNFSGINDKISQGVVNSIGQIALQGRKYGIGFLVIAQRTVNVSKTILTQCNTVICFQAFDETSFTFLGNYVGKDMVQALPNLKQYHAVVAGKAIRSNMPMIVDLTR